MFTMQRNYKFFIIYVNYAQNNILTLKSIISNDCVASEKYNI